MQDYEKLGVFYLGRQIEPSGGAPGSPLLYDSKDLTTHAVCVGMTGSGKTGLCLALLEEAALDGIPALCIDPKGDLANLLLTFPELAPADFEPWVDPAEAARKGLSAAEHAAQLAALWRKGLAEWDQAPERIGRLREAVDIAVYTPGSNTGLPLSVMHSLAAPGPELAQDAAAVRDRIATVVSGVLGLLGRDADPLRSREHMLLSGLVEHAWSKGVSVDLASLIAGVRRPPFDRVGALDVETFFPSKERMELAMALNGLLASPGFSAWLHGEPLDVQRLLFTPAGKPRISIISIAHLSDAERMFAVTLVLNEVIAWMRAQPGTSSLRAIFYMDEIFGYFPPTANPPAKTPMLTLLKQARAYGLGCVLATQNPVDLDYKGLSNAGTWFIGRLQTERDKLRVLDGLESALAGASDRETLDRMISGLRQRVFLMRNVHEDAPVLFETRWVLSWLRGPMTGAEISRLMAPRKSRASAEATPPPVAATSVPEAARPTVPAGVPEYFLTSASPAAGITYRPAVMGLAKLHFVNAKLGLDEWRTQAYLAPFSESGDSVSWSEAQSSADLKSRLVSEPREGATFEPLPASALRAASYAEWGRALAAHLYETARAQVLVCDALKMTSHADEAEGDFRSRIALKAHEHRDRAVEALREKLARKLASLQERERKALERLNREKAQLSQQKLQTALSVGASILGALLGRRTLSASNVTRAASAARSAGRIGRESGDIERAGESLEAVQSQLAELQRQLQAEIDALHAAFDPSTVSLRKIEVSPRKSDIMLGEVALVWSPWRRSPDGFLEAA